MGQEHLRHPALPQFPLNSVAGSEHYTEALQQLRHVHRPPRVPGNYRMDPTRRLGDTINRVPAATRSGPPGFSLRFHIGILFPSSQFYCKLSQYRDYPDGRQIAQVRVGWQSPSRTVRDFTYGVFVTPVVTPNPAGTGAIA